MFYFLVYYIGAMSDRIEDVRKGYLILLPVLDEQGRAVIYFNPSLMEDKVEPVVQVWWYLTHVAMENPRVRKHGFVLLGNDKDMKLRHFYPKRVLGKCLFVISTYLLCPWILYQLR